MKSGCVNVVCLSGAVEDVRTFLLDESRKPSETVERIREVLKEASERVVA
jgi:hypothetical protein